MERILWGHGISSREDAWNVEVHTQKDLDDVAGGYKDIDEGMEALKDLLRFRTKHSPIAVIKG